MQTWTNELPLTSFSPLSLDFFPEQALFFDIETTGLSAKYHTIYCIGCCYRTGSSLRIVQFFADTPREEPEILLEFLSFSDHFSSLISFNGIRFDVPFADARCQYYRLPSRLSDMAHLDIYAACFKIRHLLSLPSCKQKNIELFLNLQRKDRCDGEELIAVYKDYVKTPSQQALHLMKLHNYEDLIGMPHLLSMLSYLRILETPCTVSDVEYHTYTDNQNDPAAELLITGCLPVSVPVPLRLHDTQYYVRIEDDRIKCAVSLSRGPMRYYLKDYRNYDFLPEENKVIHKSLSAYLPTDRKEPATPDNCYLSQSGYFFPLPLGMPIAKDVKLFIYGPNDRRSYLLYSDDAWKKEFWACYLGQILTNYNKKKKPDAHI